MKNLPTLALLILCMSGMAAQNPSFSSFDLNFFSTNGNKITITNVPYSAVSGAPTNIPAVTNSTTATIDVSTGPIRFLANIPTNKAIYVSQGGNDLDAIPGSRDWPYASLHAAVPIAIASNWPVIIMIGSNYVSECFSNIPAGFRVHGEDMLGSVIWNGCTNGFVASPSAIGLFQSTNNITFDNFSYTCSYGTSFGTNQYLVCTVLPLNLYNITFQNINVFNSPNFIFFGPVNLTNIYFENSRIITANTPFAANKVTGWIRNNWIVTSPTNSPTAFGVANNLTFGSSLPLLGGVEIVNNHFELWATNGYNLDSRVNTALLVKGNTFYGTNFNVGYLTNVFYKGTTLNKDWIILRDNVWLPGMTFLASAASSTITPFTPFFWSTNAAPSNVTIGVTVPDFWSTFIGPDGNTNWIPSWRNH